MLTKIEIKNLTEKLREIVGRGSVTWDSVDRCWLVKYKDGEFNITDAYRLTANKKGFINFSRIEVEI